MARGPHFEGVGRTVYQIRLGLGDGGIWGLSFLLSFLLSAFRTGDSNIIIEGVEVESPTLLIPHGNPQRRRAVG
jgi:hypothetical protein